MFADIAGSTQLYERLGDQLAHRCVVEGLSTIASHAKQNNGRLIETIGDEVMLTFPTTIAAVTAATKIQHHFLNHPVCDEHFLRIRIGFHRGPVEFAGTHPFGDTINVAARVVALCDAGRIITTSSTIAHTTGISARPYQTTRVKGKSAPLKLQEILWDSDYATSLHPDLHLTQTYSARPVQIKISYGNQFYEICSKLPPFTIGRGDECRLVIQSELASRTHAHLEVRWGEVFLRDFSTNGTFVCRGATESTKSSVTSTRIHRREVLLQGTGAIAIGMPVHLAAPECLLQYAISTVR